MRIAQPRCHGDARVSVKLVEIMIAHIILGILLLFEGLSKRESCHKLVYIDGITRHTAILYWRSEESRDSKILCAGIRQYVTALGETEVDLDTVTQFVPPGVDRAFLSHLQPNFNYSCVVQAESPDQSGGKTRPLLFSTHYAAPEAPEQPAIVYRNDGKQIDIQLLPSSTKYGPIDGYEVQFHIIDEHTSHAHGQLDLPRELTRPRGLLASIEEAHSSRHPVAFCLAFRNSSLPSHITISDSLLQGAVRSGTTYSVVTAAYTDNYDHGAASDQISLYSLSPPSKLFSLIVTSEELRSSEGSSSLEWLERQLLKWSMAVGVASSNIILFYFLLVGCGVVCVTRRKWRRLNQLSEATQHCIKYQEEGSSSTGAEPPTSPRIDCTSLPTAREAAMCYSDPSPEDKSGSEEVLLSVKGASGDIMLPGAEMSSFVGGEEPTMLVPDQEVELLSLESTGSIPPNSNPDSVQSSSGAASKSHKSVGRMSGGSEALLPVGSSHCTGLSVLQSVRQSGSSLVFVPRGLSRGPLSQSRSTTADLAPDLEMDLYGISYSLDEPQDH